MLSHTVTLRDQCAAEFGHQFLTAVLFRAESRGLDTVEYTFSPCGVRHLMEKCSVERFPVSELLFLRHDNFVFRNRIVCAVLMSWLDRANPEVVSYHRIDRLETELRSIFGPKVSVLLLQSLPQFRPCFPQIGLGHIEHSEYLHLGIDVILLFIFV